MHSPVKIRPLEHTHIPDDSCLFHCSHNLRHKYTQAQCSNPCRLHLQPRHELEAGEAKSEVAAFQNNVVDHTHTGVFVMVGLVELPTVALLESRSVQPARKCDLKFYAGDDMTFP